MFKPIPNIVVSQECGNVPDGDYSVNWEDIARWALEHGNLEDTEDCPLPGDTAAAHGAPAIDWCRVADSFMRDEAAESVDDTCDTNEVNRSLRAHDQPFVFSDSSYPRGSLRDQAALEYKQLPPHIPQRRTHTPVPYHRTSTPARNYSYIGNSDYNRSIRDSDFDDTSGCNGTSLSSIREFSCMEEDFMHDSSENYQSDIMSYLERSAERNRPNSIAESYHFAGRAYGRADDCDEPRMITSSPKKQHRTTRAETFEMADGSKMFNVTLDECLSFGRRLRHISDVRDTNGCQVMCLDRKIDEDSNGAKYRVDIARRWLD